MRRCCLAGSLLAVFATNVFAEDVADLADRVVEAAGVKAGLAVHVGFGDGASMVGLSQRGNFLVHGISPDGACVEKARAEIQALG